MKRSLMIAASLVAGFGLAQASQADVIIGNFEGAAEAGWGSWSGGVAAFSPGVSVSNEAATLGTGSVKIDISGWGQHLAYSGGTAGTIADFVANNTLEFDVIFPATASSGWAELFEVVLNSQYGGFTAISSGAMQVGWGDGGGGAQTLNVALDYSAIRQTWIDNGTPGWVELVFAFNDDGNHPVKYVDNVRVTPEPASAALLGLGGLMLSSRRRKA
jgi:hypothetical protein